MMTYSYGKQSISPGDIQEVTKVFDSPFLTQGPKVKEFEKAICDYTGAKYTVAVANGTAALHIAALAAGIKQGDEVITSPNTFLASANCVLYAGGTVRFADIDNKTACIDPLEIEKHITKATKAIIPVHFAGICCDMEKIAQIAKKHNLLIIEDAAHAIGSEYKGSKVGNCAHSLATIFSFHPVKTITSGEGGAVTTNDKDLYEKLLALRSHGIYRKNRWEYEMRDLGFNYRLTDIQAALGISQLKRIGIFAEKRRRLFAMYAEAFKGDERFSLLEEPVYSKACYHLCPLLIDFDKIKISKEELFDKFREKGLFLQVHYIPVHTQPYYQKLGFKWGDFPKAENYYRRELSLPLYPDLTEEDIKVIVKIIKELAI
ncbi:MAG: UDP-4-amino-4,6-dideoxy-N-acetyl-beta-L-altrosamine transaminase [Phycisphaerales bacterium]